MYDARYILCMYSWIICIRLEVDAFCEIENVSLKQVHFSRACEIGNAMPLLLPYDSPIEYLSRAIKCINALIFKFWHCGHEEAGG